MLRRSVCGRRGSMPIEPWMGTYHYPISPNLTGAVSCVQPGHDHWKYLKPGRPLRAIGIDKPLPPVLFNRMDQIILIENALALQRVENQISVTLSQLSLGVRNAENFLENHLLNKEVRPSIHTLWFHEEGLRHSAHVLSNLGAHHLVPLFSLVSYDVERGKMTMYEAEELYEELMDCSVAQPKIVQRELANQMIRVYCLHDEYDKCFEVLEEMKAKGIRRTFVTYAPIFRYNRLKEDAEKQSELLQLMYKLEGGRINKFVYIDIPRMLYMYGVFIRYNWVAINFLFSTFVTAALLYLYNVRDMTYELK
ncbi:hypothetical protein AGDE_01957 [Angomonas deanei]|nr:hypothetical protein AGDE_01957 [Angomonas deanei]|eukprot:EPY41966.1 hypothetical protein AGDE_01957 [Angomonas deanei]